MARRISPLNVVTNTAKTIPTSSARTLNRDRRWRLSKAVSTAPPATRRKRLCERGDRSSRCCIAGPRSPPWLAYAHSRSAARLLLVDIVNTQSTMLKRQSALRFTRVPRVVVFDGRRSLTGRTLTASADPFAPPSSYLERITLNRAPSDWSCPRADWRPRREYRDPEESSALGLENMGRQRPECSDTAVRLFGNRMPCHASSPNLDTRCELRTLRPDPASRHGTSLLLTA